jgi:signal recognition particle receptor subunit beta
VCDANRLQNDSEQNNDYSEDALLFRNFLLAVRTSPALAHAALLVFCNKQDLPESASVALCTDRLGLHAIWKRQWYIQSCAGISGEGLRDGFTWLVDALLSKYDTTHREGDVEEGFEWPEMGGGMTKSAAKR